MRIKMFLVNMLKKSTYIVPDRLYISLYYYVKTRRRMNWKNPQTFNEKLQWLKLYDRKPGYSQMVDKYEAKRYVAERIGEQYIIPTFGMWDKFEEIDFEALPDQFVLKCTHDSGGVIICRDKSSLDREEARKKINECLGRNYYYSSREWPYKNVKPRILAEQYLEDTGHTGSSARGAEKKMGMLTDYKLFCFDGVPKVILTVRGGHEDESKVIRRMYSPEWDLLKVGLRGHEPHSEAEERPDSLNEMLRIASRLSEGHKFLRVDLYDANGRIYFGEMTFFHMSGIERFTPASFDREMGEMIDLG